MTVDELGQRTKAKHPEYGHYSDSEVGARVLSKYPEYRSQIGSEQPGTSYAEQLEPGIYGETNPTGQKILENLGQVAGGYGIAQLIGAGAMKAGNTRLGKALLNSPETIGRQMEPGLEAAGITRRPPELGASVKFENPYQYPSSLSNPRGGKFTRGKPEIPAEPLPSSVPIKYPSDPASFHNFAKLRIAQFASDPRNIQITPQELNDYKRVLSGTLSEMKAKGMSGTPLFSDLSNLNSNVSDIHSSVIPGRAELNKVYALSKGIRAIPGKVRSAATKTAKAAAVVGGGLGLLKYLGQ